MPERLILYADGACWPNPGPASFGVLVEDAEGRVVCRLRKDIGHATNNVAEWRGAIAALSYVSANPCRSAELRMDSRMVVQQLTGAWKTKLPHLAVLMHEGRRVLAALRASGVAVTVRWVPREQNMKADAIAAPRGPQRPFWAGHVGSC